MNNEQIIELLIDSFIAGYNTAIQSLDAAQPKRDEMIKRYKDRLEALNESVRK